MLEKGFIAVVYVHRKITRMKSKNWSEKLDFLPKRPSPTENTALRRPVGIVQTFRRASEGIFFPSKPLQNLGLPTRFRHSKKPLCCGII